MLSTKTPTLKAFSLLELLIVIGLLAGIMGITIPVAFRTFEVSLNRELRDISTFVDDLRFLSILQNRHFRLVFDFDNDEVYVEAQIAGVWKELKEEFPVIDLQEGITLRYFKRGEHLITARQARVNILPFGYIEPFQITLQQGNDNLLYQVTTVLGRSTITTDEALFY